MPALLRLLIVEDSVDDALLAVREFKRAGYEVSAREALSTGLTPSA
jgi:hypothetical protein